MERKQTEADGIICSNASVVEQYNGTLRAIRSLETELENGLKDLQDSELIIQNLKVCVPCFLEFPQMFRL